LLLLGGILTNTPLCAGETDPPLSPYLYVPGADEGSDPIPLKHTDVSVHISGMIAEVNVEQTYQNLGSIPLEAQYIFPGSTRSAIHGMTLQVGERIIRARVKEKQKARVEYEAAREAGKTASLLEQKRPNVFQMSVANILPGDTLKVSLQYTELLVPEDQVYQFVFPTVVGPRYSDTPLAEAKPEQQWVANPYLAEGTESPTTFSMRLDIDAGLPLEDLRCRTHKVITQYKDETSAHMSLAPDEATSNNRDFILDYRLAGQAIHSGLLLHEGKDENFFLAMVQPPAREAITELPPRDYVFIVDVSGSMSGFPLQTAKKLMEELFDGMNEADTFNLLLFAGGSEVLSNTPLQATPQNIRKARNLLDGNGGGGSTRLLPALRRAFNLAAPENGSRSFVVLTDGYVDVEYETFDIIRENLNRANVFAFGIGSSVNRFLIEGMARTGQGEAFIATDPEEAYTVGQRFVDMVSTPVLTDLSYEFDGFEAYDVEPAKLPDLFAQRPVVIHGKWKGEPTGSIRIHGRINHDDITQTLEVADATDEISQPALPYLWARKRIEELGDFNALRSEDENVQAITNLGLTYNLATQYTSFIAVDETPRNTTGQLKTQKQPLPLPKGVSNLAVGSVPSTPEPRSILLALGAALVFGLALYRKFGERSHRRSHSIK